MEDDPEVIEVQAEVVTGPLEKSRPKPLGKKRTDAEVAALRLKNMEDELFEEALKTMRDMGYAFDLEYDEDGRPIIPDEWRAELDDKALKRRMRIAANALLPQKDAAFALHASKSIAASIIKARATEKAGPKTLNAVVIMPETVNFSYAEKEVDS